MAETKLLQILGQLVQIYPHWRFGQLAANMAGLADLPLEKISDEQLADVSQRHLDRRLDALQIPRNELSNRGSSAQELLDALREYYQTFPGHCLGNFLLLASKHAKAEIFDIEDGQLLEGVKSLILNRPVPTGPIP